MRFGAVFVCVFLGALVGCGDGDQGDPAGRDACSKFVYAYAGRAASCAKQGGAPQSFAQIEALEQGKATRAFGCDAAKLLDAGGVAPCVQALETLDCATLWPPLPETPQLPAAACGGVLGR